MSNAIHVTEARTATNVAVPPALWPWVLGLLAAAAAAAGLYWLPPELRQRVPPDWSDLLYLPALVGHGLAVGLLIALLAEWWCLGRRRREVRELHEGEGQERVPGAEDGRLPWAVRAWRQTRSLPQERLTVSTRRQNLLTARALIEARLNTRWRLYLMLCVAPAALGLVVGERSQRLNPSPELTYWDHYLPLCVGTLEGVVLLLLAMLVRWRASALAGYWQERVTDLDHLGVAPPQPAAAAEQAAPVAVIPIQAPPLRPLPAGPAATVPAPAAPTWPPSAEADPMTFEE